MTFQEFIFTYNGKGIDVDGAYGVQCMDLMHRYCIDCLGLSRNELKASSAYLIWRNFNSLKGHELFQKIPNTPTNVPREGDIVIFGQDVGVSGHVCIFRSGDLKKFKSLDQNWPAGSFTHTQDHTYKGVLGWLRFIRPVEAPVIPQNNPQIDTTQLSTPKEEYSKPQEVVNQPISTPSPSVEEAQGESEASQAEEQAPLQVLPLIQPSVELQAPSFITRILNILRNLWSHLKTNSQ